MSLTPTTDTQGSGGGLPTWAKAVIAISIIVFAIVVTVVIILVVRNRSKKKAVRDAKALNRAQLGK